MLSDKAKLSLYKKSATSGISTGILEEVYCRGYESWDESFDCTPEQLGFDRVNSFIAGGFAVELDEDLKPVPSVEKIAKRFDKPVATIKKAIKTGSTVEKEHTKDQKTAEKIATAHVNEFPNYYKKLEKAGLEEDLENACWKGYEAVGMKKKNGKKVPNCVPVKESKFKTPETAELQDTNSDNPTSRFIGTNQLTNTYTENTPGQESKTLSVVKRIVKERLEEDWQKVNRQDKTDGLSQKAVDAYRREHPGSKLKTAVTEKDPKGKRASRRKSFCSRMGGMKKRLTSAETARDPDSRINKALRKWHCEDNQVNELNVPLGTTGNRAEVKTPLVAIRMADGKIKRLPPGKSGSSGGGGK